MSNFGFKRYIHDCIAKWTINCNVKCIFTFFLFKWNLTQVHLQMQHRMHAQAFLLLNCFVNSFALASATSCKHLQVQLSCNLKCTLNVNVKCRCAFRWTIRCTPQQHWHVHWNVKCILFSTLFRIFNCFHKDV